MRAFPFRPVLPLLLGFALAAPVITIGAGWRLIGLTGQQGSDDIANYPDRMLFEINLTNGVPTQLFKVTYVPDTQSIGYNPRNGLLYHFGGVESWGNNPLREGNDQGEATYYGQGFSDCQYLETINLQSRVFQGIYNANPCPNPDPTLSCCGLDAPRPDWVVPTTRRDSTQVEPIYRERGTNEFHAVRNSAWYEPEGRFYLATENGIFALTPTGASTFLYQPSEIGSNAKGIAFVTLGGITRLMVGQKEGAGDALSELDLVTGAVTNTITLLPPPGGGDPTDLFGGLLGLAQHPVTGVLYGLRKTGDAFARELVTIDPATGATTLVGNIGKHIASITFHTDPPLRIQNATRSGSNLIVTWSGGNPPYQVKTRTGLGTGTWTNSGAPTSSTTATIPITGTEGYVTVTGQ